MSETGSALHIGSTITRVEGTPWRVVVHWHSDGDQLIPAGIEVRCYAIDDDDESDFWGGQEHPKHEQPHLDPGGRSRAVSSDLLNRRLKLGPLIGAEAARLSRMLADSARETADLHQGSAAFMLRVSKAAGGLTRATDDTYQLVAALYREALESEHRSRPAVYVLERLADAHGYPLSTDTPSDRVKVRQWIGEARKRGYLPKSTANNNTRRNPS